MNETNVHKINIKETKLKEFRVKKYLLTDKSLMKRCVYCLVKRFHE